MPRYIRSNQKGGCYFFTLVSFQRRKILTNTSVRRALRQSILEVRTSHPFEIDAWVLLPDHLHCIWTLPTHDADYSKRWGLIKARTTKRLSDAVSLNDSLSGSKERKRESSVWQRRFWEHGIRDQADFNRHLDYIHFNPTKHGLAGCPGAWPYSSFHRYVDQGYYPSDWGEGVNIEGDFGE